MAEPPFVSDKVSSDVKYAAIDASSSGDNEIVAAVTGVKIRVVSMLIMSGGDVNATFQSGAGGSGLSGALPLTTNSGASCNHNPVGWFETNESESLNLSLSGAIQVSGFLAYREINAAVRR
jgi:hypothetical protein